jgi:hypothetical protein
MGLHLYCVTPAGVLPRTIEGLDEAPVRAIEIAGLAVWVSAAEAPPRASVEAARRHHAVVEAAMREVTPVPLRFGQWLDDEAGVRERAAARAPEWNALLAELAGTAEYGVRIVDPRLSPAVRDVRPQHAESGRAYLEAIAGRDAARSRKADEGRRVAEQLEEALRPHVLRSRVDALDTPRGLAAAAFLVRRPEADAYGAALARAIASHAPLRFLTSGPWPPYSFAT